MEIASVPGRLEAMNRIGTMIIIAVFNIVVPMRDAPKDHAISR